MKTSIGVSLRIDAPKIFRDPDFVAWLNSSKRKFTWHQGGEPDEYSDVVVLVDPSLTGEGSDDDMPEHIWLQIVEACRANVGQQAPMSEHITVRLTNVQG